MANTKSAKKKIRKDKKRTKRNQIYLRKIKFFFKKIKKEKDEKEQIKLLKETCSLIDKAAKEKIIHKNKAARLKSQISKFKKIKK